MLQQRIVKHLLTVGVLFQQRKGVQFTAEQQRQRQNPDLRIQQPAPHRARRQTADRIATGQQAQGHP
ncbi:hypothetical protein D3C76_1421680 [compost metagenome]